MIIEFDCKICRRRTFHLDVDGKLICLTCVKKLNEIAEKFG